MSEAKGMADAALKGKGGIGIAIEVEGPDAMTAAARLLKAIEAKDAAGIDDALRMHYAACEDEENADEGE